MNSIARQVREATRGPRFRHAEGYLRDIVTINGNY
jgi:hypothetical protein